MSCVIASKRKEGVKQRGLPVERIYPLLEFELIKQDKSRCPSESNLAAAQRARGARSRSYSRR